MCWKILNKRKWLHRLQILLVFMRKWIASILISRVRLMFWCIADIHDTIDDTTKWWQWKWRYHIIASCLVLRSVAFSLDHHHHYATTVKVLTGNKTHTIFTYTVKVPKADHGKAKVVMKQACKDEEVSLSSFSEHLFNSRMWSGVKNDLTWEKKGKVNPCVVVILGEEDDRKRINQTWWWWR